ncbi:MAG: molybdopterin-dependent oxidoreductase [Chloroflexi bacterium]|nr:molybdopterin-dependent oxidoreductase [Chloroflexota bacterium]
MSDLLRSRRGQGPHSGVTPATWSRRALLVGAFQALTLLAACTARPPNPPADPGASPAGNGGGTPSPTPATPATPLNQGGGCVLAAVVRPTPMPYPGYSEMEPSTGLHVTGPAQEVDLATYRLKVIGLVEQPLSLSYDDVRCLPKVQAHVSLNCPGYFTDEVSLSGATFASVLALARPQAKAVRVTITSVEGRTTPFALEEVQAPENFLAYQWKEEPLPPSHGFPLRAVFPAKAGTVWVKWVTQLELS